MSCNCLTIRIDNRDIISATGNTLHPDNTIFVGGLLDCQFNQIEEQFTVPGYYCYCVNDYVPVPICFNLTTPLSTNDSVFISTEFTDFYNGRPYYTLTSGSTTIGFVWFEDNDELWLFTSTLGGGTFYSSLYNNADISPISSPTYEWNEIDPATHINHSTTNTCPDNICFYQTINGNEFTCQLSPNGYYNEKPYFKRLNSDCTTFSGDYIFWNSTSSRWEISTSLGGLTVKAYNTNPGIYPITVDSYTWTSLTTNYSIDYTYSGDCEAILCGIQGYSYNISDTPPLLINNTLYSTTLDFDFYYYKDDVLTPVVYSTYYNNDTSCTNSEECCPDLCTTQVYCIDNTGMYDDNYIESGLHNNKPHWIGVNSELVIYYSTGQTQWCLSTSLDGICLLSGKSPCSSNCPDLCDEYFSEGYCTTTTTIPPIDCNVLDFDALFNCFSTTTTTSTTTTSTTTTTTTTLPPCNLVVDAVISTFTTTTTSTTTTTTTTIPPVVRPCNFIGEVSFNTINGNIICPD